MLWNYETIDDWEARIASYTDEQKQVYQALIPRTLELKSLLADTEGWTVLSNDKKNDVYIECKKQKKSGCMSVRARGALPFAPEDVWRVI